MNEDLPFTGLEEWGACLEEITAEWDASIEEWIRELSTDPSTGAAVSEHDPARSGDTGTPGTGFEHVSEHDPAPDRSTVVAHASTSEHSGEGAGHGGERS